MMETTLNAIRKHGPCGLKPAPDGTRTGLCKLMHHLGKTTTDDEPLSILTILDSNGLEDALWCLRAVSRHDRDIRWFSVWCARQVQHLMTDPRSLAALDVAEQFALGRATTKELAAARAAAWAAGDAVDARTTRDARAAAWAAGDAVDARTTRDAGAAWAAVWATAEDAAWTASAAMDAWAARATEDVSWAARAAAGAAAEDAARVAQECELRRLLNHGSLTTTSY